MKYQIKYRAGLLRPWRVVASYSSITVCHRFTRRGAKRAMSRYLKNEQRADDLKDELHMEPKKGKQVTEQMALFDHRINELAERVLDLETELDLREGR